MQASGDRKKGKYTCIFPCSLSGIFNTPFHSFSFPQLCTIAPCCTRYKHPQLLDVSLNEGNVSPGADFYTTAQRAHHPKEHQRALFRSEGSLHHRNDTRWTLAWKKTCKAYSAAIVLKMWAFLSIWQQGSSFFEPHAVQWCVLYPNLRCLSCLRSSITEFSNETLLTHT